MMRYLNRKNDQMRPVSFEMGLLRHAEGSCKVHFGLTEILVSASVENQIPPFLRGQNRGWLSAQYALMTRSTPTRNDRRRQLDDGRSREISRLIGRSLRSVIDFERLGERQIMIDCDVIDADAGTRTAAITGGFMALAQACHYLVQHQFIESNPLKDSVSAVSIILKNQSLLLDPDYLEDSTADSDTNFVFTGKGQIVEAQASAEKNTFSCETFTQSLYLAQKTCAKIRQLQKTCLQKSHIDSAIFDSSF
ncbi:MAG: ribonuclease PH [Pseudomonadota bacterium]